MRRLIMALLALCVVVGASAPQCFHLPRHHSKSTLDKWAEWRTRHPHWKPSIPVEELCDVELASQEPVELIPDVPPMDTQVATLETFLEPSESPQLPVETVMLAGFEPEFVNGVYAVVPSAPAAPTPEPSTLAMIGTGLFGLAAFSRKGARS